MRLRIQPDDVRRAGVAFSAARDDVAQAAAGISAVALPAMPPAMAARHQQALAQVAARLTLATGELAQLGEELRVRATAAELADAASADGPGAVRMLARALERSDVVTEASAVGAGLAATGAALRVTTATGGSVVIAERELGLGAPPAPPAGTGADARPATGVGDARGGLPAVAVQDALAESGGGADGGLPAPLHDTSDGGGLRASCDDGSSPLLAPHDQPPADSLDRQAWGCWMAGRAAAAGLPPELPLMTALARSGLRNLPPGDDGAGFFGIDAGSAYAPPGYGLSHGAQPGGDWWAEHPGAQLDYALQRLRQLAGGARDAGLDDPEALGRWAAEATGMHASDAAAFADAHGGAAALVAQCGAGAAPLDGGALAAARSQLGVHEAGVNAGLDVDRYLAAAGVGSGNPWCAGFVTWSVEQAGGRLPGGGWAAVEHWVAAAQAQEHGLSIVDAAHARPGDVVAFDWGGEGDFGADGHIGFLDSAVAPDGSFQTIEGNAGDAVAHLARSTVDGHVVFIRLGA